MTPQPSPESLERGWENCKHDPNFPYKKICAGCAIEALDTARQEEREACAKEADKYKENCGSSMSRHSTATYIAAAIRNRGK